MKDTNFIEVLPFDEVEILDEGPPLGGVRFRVTGLSKSQNVVTLGLLDTEGHVVKTLMRPPYQLRTLLVSTDPRTGAKYPVEKTEEDRSRYMSVYQAFVKKILGDFDEWKA